MHTFRIFSYCLLSLLALFCPSRQATACTGIQIIAQDGTVIHARTMEFGLSLKSSVLLIPRDLAFTGTTPSGAPGLEWKAKYAAVGMNGLGKVDLVDGVNEKGLAGGIFYLPSYAQYQPFAADQASRTLASWETITWLLTNFATIEEVRAALPEVRVSDAALEGQVPPVHYIVRDASGKSLVIEYTGGELHLYDNPVGVITNSPDFDWHLKNLSNYVNLTATNVPPVDFDGLEIKQLGQGSGLLGLPGDFTPPSRFVRAAAFSQSAQPGETGFDAIHTAFHVLDSFDIPRGVVRGSKDDKANLEYTQWTTASDTRSCSLYFHTYEDRRVRRVDLLDSDLNAIQPLFISLDNRAGFDDMNTLARPSEQDQASDQ